MTIEITKPETEALIQRYLQSGQFHDIEELLTTALSALTEPGTQPVKEAKNLVELFAQLRGLNLNFERDRDAGRDIEL